MGKEMTEQTLREKLAEALSRNERVNQTTGSIKHKKPVAEVALSAFREWLDSKLAEQMIIAVKEGKSDEILSYLNDRLTAVQDALGDKK